MNANHENQLKSITIHDSFENLRNPLPIHENLCGGSFVQGELVSYVCRSLVVRVLAKADNMCISASQCLLAFYLGCFAVRFAQGFAFFGVPRFVFGYFGQTRFNVRHCHLFVYVAVQLRARALSIEGGIAVVRSQCLLSFVFHCVRRRSHTLLCSTNSLRLRPAATLRALASMTLAQVAWLNGSVALASTLHR